MDTVGNGQIIANWPAKATTELVKTSESKGTDPEVAEFTGFSRILKEHPEEFCVDVKILLEAALRVAKRHPKGTEVIGVLEKEISALK